MIQRLHKNRQQNETGFTLVELLVVIVILGILAAIVVFAVGGIADKGQTSACATDRTSLATAEESFFASRSPIGYYIQQDGIAAPAPATSWAAGNSDLVLAQFIHTASSTHFVTVSGGAPVGANVPAGATVGTSYSITGYGACPPAG